MAHVKALLDRVLNRPDLVFLCIAFLIAVPCALFVPAGAGADEPTHVARILQIAEGRIFSSVVSRDEIQIVDVPDGDDDIFGGASDSAIMELCVRNMTRFQGERMSSVFPTWNDSEYGRSDDAGNGTLPFPFSNTAVNSPLPYLPSVLTYKFMSLFSNSSYWLVIAMRFGNVAAFLLLSLVCIRLVPVGKWVFTAVCTLPGLLAVFSMATADSISFCICMLFLALLLKYLYTPNTVTNLTNLLLVITCCCLGLIKLTYIPLIGLLILLPICRKEFRTPSRVAFLSGAFLAALVVFFIWYMQIHSINTGAIYRSTIDPDTQKELLLLKPLYVLKLAVLDLLSQPLFGFGGIGVIRATEKAAYSGIFSLVIFICALLYCGDGERKFRCSMTDKQVNIILASFLLITCVVSLLIELALFLQFTPVGTPAILGVQDRYFYALFPLVMFAAILLFHTSSSSRKTGALLVGCELLNVCVMFIVIRYGIF